MIAEGIGILILIIGMRIYLKRKKYAQWIKEFKESAEKPGQKTKSKFGEYGIAMSPGIAKRYIFSAVSVGLSVWSLFYIGLWAIPAFLVLYFGGGMLLIGMGWME